MRLVLIRNAIQYPFGFRCSVCGYSFRTDINAGCAVDPDGAAYEAYYCGACAKKAAETHGIKVEHWHPDYPSGE